MSDRADIGLRQSTDIDLDIDADTQLSASDDVTLSRAAAELPTTTALRRADRIHQHQPYAATRPRGDLHPKLTPAPNGEYQATDAVIAFARDNDVLIHPVTGEYHDCGNPTRWLATNKCRSPG